MYKRKCLMCGKEFLREYNSQKYCSEECRLKYYYKKKNPENNLICEYCRKAFTSPCERKYCSFECCVLANPAKEKISKTGSEIKQIPTTDTISKINSKKRNFVSIPDILRRCKEEKTSYGKYVRKYGL